MSDQVGADPYEYPDMDDPEQSPMGLVSARSEFDVSSAGARCGVCWGSHGCHLRPGHDGDVHVCLDEPGEDGYDPDDVVCSTSEGNLYVMYPSDYSAA